MNSQHCLQRRHIQHNMQAIIIGILIIVWIWTMMVDCVFGGENLKCLTEKNDELLYTSMVRQADKQFNSRCKSVENAMKTSAGTVEYKNQLRTKYLAMLGTLPDKTELNAKVTGVIQCDDYRIEKIVTL